MIFPNLFKVNESKVRLNLAISPGAWLIPSEMVINTQSVVDYNNQLKQATTGMKLGINNEINKNYQNVGIPVMTGQKSYQN